MLEKLALVIGVGVGKREGVGLGLAEAEAEAEGGNRGCVRGAVLSEGAMGTSTTCTARAA